MGKDEHTAKSGQGLRARCAARRDELEQALAQLGPDGSPGTRRDLELALNGLDGLLTGNLDVIPPTLAAQLSRWLESSKYLGMKETRELAAARPPR